MNDGATRTIVACVAMVASCVALLLGVLVLAGSGSQTLCGGPRPSVSASGEPPLASYYLGAAKRYRLGTDGYAYLAAINKIETAFGTDMAVSSAGAIGWMQFEPSTFSKYEVSVTDPSAPADPQDPQDAIYTAANMLRAHGAPNDWGAAVYAYNHAGWYVTEVGSTAERYIGADGLENLQADIDADWGNSVAESVALTPPQPSSVHDPTDGAPSGNDDDPDCGGTSSLVVDVTPVPGKTAVIMPSGLARPPANAPESVQAMVSAGDRITPFDYQWGGGHADPELSDNQADPQPQGGSEPGQSGTPGYDCSGATDYVLWGGGYGSTLLEGDDPTSGQLARLGVAGVDPSGWVTWYANAGHVFIEVAGVVLDTAHNYSVSPAHPNTGPRWQPAGDISAEQSEDGLFNPRHLNGV
jgi:hypothetical protein